MDVNYFLDQAQNSTREEFNKDWMDVIKEISPYSTSLITEDNMVLNIEWENNKYKSHHNHLLSKTIVIQDFVDFINMDDRPQGVFINTHKSGYWNVYNYNEEVIKFLDDNKIKYSIEEE